MQAQVGTWTVREMARMLGVSCSGYYRFCHHKMGIRQQKTGRPYSELLAAIKTSFEASRQTYGSPRIHAELQAQGYSCSRPRVARLMKQAGLVAKMSRRCKVTTRVNQQAIVAPNLLQQNFTALVPNAKWAGDISYIKTRLCRYSQ